MNTNSDGLRYISRSQVDDLTMGNAPPRSFLLMQAQREIPTFCKSKARCQTTTPISSPSENSTPNMPSVPRNNPSKNVAKYIADNKLTAPMWDWKPFFLGLPEEVKGLIFSQFEFQLSSKAQTKSDLLHATELLRKRVSLDDPHPMNTLAATSRAMRASIEAYCRHLRESKGQTGCSHLQCSSIPPIQAGRYVILNNCFFLALFQFGINIDKFLAISKTRIARNLAILIQDWRSVIEKHYPDLWRRTDI